MNVLGNGVDVSRFQDPGKIPWATWKDKIDFAFARASYGAALADKSAIAHLQNARAVGGIKVGLYHFFRDIHSAESQFNTFQAIAASCRLGPGDIVPAVDLESDSFAKRAATPAWSEPAQRLVELLRGIYGECIVYINNGDFALLGHPAWILERPIWIARYTADETVPTIGGKTPIIWQDRVDDFDPNGPGGYDEHAKSPIDQSRRLAPLPLIPPHITDEDRARVEGQVALSLDEQIRNIAVTEPDKLV
jgi:GH25 family lysozyme M1 (1,4-beta-N-acetylmuramidase)